MCLWDLEERRLLREFKGHRSWVRGVAFLPDSPLAISGGNDASVFVWNVQAKEDGYVRELMSHTGPVGAIAVSRFGRYFASSGWDNTIRVWEALFSLKQREMREQHIYRGHTDAVPTVIFSKPGHFLLSGSLDKTVRLWDVATETEVRCFRGHDGAANSVDLTPDCQWALSGSEDHTVRLWGVDAQKEAHCFQGHSDGVLAVAFCPGGEQAISAGRDGTFRVWQLPPVDQRPKAPPKKKP